MGSASSDMSGDAGHDAHCLRAWRGTRARHAVSADMSGGAQGWARRVRVPQPGRGNGSSLLSARRRPTSSCHASRAHACEYLRSAGAANMWATRVAQTRSGDQCRGCGQCVANVAHVARARVVRGGGANRVARPIACLVLRGLSKLSMRTLLRRSAQRAPVVGALLRACVAFSADHMGAGPL